MNSSALARTRSSLLALAVAFMGLALGREASAIIIVGGSPVTSVPSYVPATLGQHQFLLPIEAIGAAGLQDWSFNLGFNPAVVQQVDLGGFYHGVYGAEFSAAHPVVSSITASGFLFDGLLEGVAGFSWGATGDGLIAFIAFEFLPGQSANDPDFDVGGVVVTQPVPEPSTVVLASGSLALLWSTRRRRRPAPGASTATQVAS